MKFNKKSIAVLFIVLTLVVCVFAACSKNTSESDDVNKTTEETKKTETKTETKSDAPVLGENVTLNSGEVIKKEDIQKEAKGYIPDSLPEEIESVDDLVKYNDYVETLPDGREKELLLLKMQLFLEQIQ